MTSALREIRHERLDASDAWPRAVAGDLAYLRTVMVNLYFSGLPGAGDRNWVLIDAGLPGQAHAIAEAAARRFGPNARPSAIILTHGHFDHVGSLQALVRAWDAPVFAHRLELPYLTGKSPYAPPDPSAGGGIMANLSWMYPRGPIDLGDKVRALPEDGSVPFMPGWRWIHTPGHTAGHVSLFRDSDRTLIAGDAFVTTRQESAIAVLEQRRELHGPPRYYTPDWVSAFRSVQELSALRPETAATGHGVPMSGPELHDGLTALVRDFDRVAVPHGGRYSAHPATFDEHGVVTVPPEKPGLPPALVFGLGAGVAAGLALGAVLGGRKRT